MLSKNQIRELQSLRLKKFRDARKLFIAEGIKSVTEVLQEAAGVVKHVFGTADFITARTPQLRRLNVPFTIISEAELGKISLQHAPNGALAVCGYFADASPEFDFEKEFSFYLDDVRDPGNMGTIIRLADWFGMRKIFCSPASCDLYNPKVIQSTMGAFLRVQVVYIELALLIKDCGPSHVYGGLLNGSNIYGERLDNGLIVIGNEANGIGETNLQYITRPLTIPSDKKSGTESLNAAIASAIMASEFFRQLRQAVK
jgi:TrmH family RNA methyltransferase